MEIFRSAAHAPYLSAGVDRRRPLGADREFGLIWIVEKNFGRVLALGEVRIQRLEFRDLVARKILPHAVRLPDAVNLPRKDLARIKVERNLDRLARFHVFQVLLKIGRQHIAIGVRDQRRDAADAIDAGHHARTNLKVDDTAVLRGGQRGIVEIIERLLQLRFDIGDGRC